MLAELKKLACDFSTQPVTTGREMRELLENSPGEFCSAALGILSGDEAERVKRYLVALLWTNNLLIPCLTDAGTPQKMAESIADLARRVDPQLPAKLVNFVLERTDEEPPECIERILMILKSMPDAAGFRPLLTPLLRHSNARIRSKVALLAGEGNRNRTWFERRMLEEDPRVRANAIESAGQALTKDLRPLFRAAALDSNNRVVGNALIALYRLGDPIALGSLYDLVSHPDPAFRATAVWAMGETGDPRFLPVLGRILTDPNETIKPATFRAIRKLRAKDIENAGVLNVSILSRPILVEREVSLAFGVSDGGKPVRAIPPTQVRILVNGDDVFRYSLVEQEYRRNISVAFLVSKSLRDRNQAGALETCFSNRRPGDSWTIVQHTGARPDTGSRQEVLFGVRLETVEATHIRSITTLLDLQRALEGVDRGKGVDFATAYASICQELRPSRLSAHLFLLDPVVEGISSESLIRIAEESRITVHTLCTSSNQLGRELSEATGGFYRMTSDLAGALTALYRGLGHRYHLTAGTNCDLKTVQVIVRTPEMLGESGMMTIES